MMKLTEIYGVLKTHSDVLKYAQEVASKQKDIKRVAIDKVIEHYERAVKANTKLECWFKPMPDYRCKKCGGGDCESSRTVSNRDIWRKSGDWLH